jgi:hypothetical protein
MPVVQPDTRLNTSLRLEHKVKIKPAKEVKEEMQIIADPLIKNIDWETLKNNQS